MWNIIGTCSARNFNLTQCCSNDLAAIHAALLQQFKTVRVYEIIIKSILNQIITCYQEIRIPEYQNSVRSVMKGKRREISYILSSHYLISNEVLFFCPLLTHSHLIHSLILFTFMYFKWFTLWLSTLCGGAALCSVSSDVVCHQISYLIVFLHCHCMVIQKGINKGYVEFNLFICGHLYHLLLLAFYAFLESSLSKLQYTEISGH